MNEHLPFVWRVNYLHEAPSPKQDPQIAHEKARQNLEKNFSGPAEVMTFSCDTQCPLWVESRHVQHTSQCPLSANSER